MPPAVYSHGSRLAIYPVILSGGSGTRLWPLSREHYPKQLLCLVGDDTLLQKTVRRLDGLDECAPPLLVCNDEHRFLVAEQLREISQQPLGILLEPVGRNTAPAATVAALALQERAQDALMLVMPADHLIADVSAFHRAVREGTDFARDGRLLTFGIVPTAPETGYGYIRRGKPMLAPPGLDSSGNRLPFAERDSRTAVHEISAFVEKPDGPTANRYFESGEYLWNSGMFLMRADAWLAEIGRLQPAMLASCRAALSGATQDLDFLRLDRTAFADCPSDSIDYAVMEKTDRAAVVPLDAKWSDIGTWSSLWEVSSQDADGNVTQGDVFIHDSRNALLIARHRMLAVVGVEDVIVVETPDAVLVADRHRAQEVRDVVSRLKQEKRTEHIMHRRVHRPWGSYEGVDAGERFQVKRLVVKPGASLSLQMHHHRAEHWVVVKGTARVVRGEERILLSENQSTYIPVGVKHRLENPGSIPLEIIEVQSGDYLGEDDIVRFEDHYNRHRKP